MFFFSTFAGDEAAMWWEKVNLYNTWACLYTHTHMVQTQHACITLTYMPSHSVVWSTEMSMNTW